MARKTVGKTEILPYDERSTSNTWYQVVIGNFGVVLPKEINMDTMNGMSLLNGEGSVIYDHELAKKVAKGMGGKVLKVTENWERVVTDPEQERSIDGLSI